MELKGIRKIFMIGDMHLGIRSNSKIWKDDMIKFIMTFLRDIQSAEPYEFNAETDILMLTGDIFHSREFLNVMIGNAAIDTFGLVCKTFKRGVFVILGNHDQYFMRDSSVHTLKFIERAFENFHVFATADELVINERYNFLMLPWHDDIAVLDKAISDHPESEYLFGHFDAIGFMYNKAVRVEKGLSVESLKRFKRVYAGHLHHMQEKGNVLFLGTPYQMDFGDADTDRGYYVIEIDENIITETFVKNVWSPVFLERDFEEIMSMNFGEAASILNSNYVNVSIPMSAMRNFSLNTFMEMLDINGIRPRNIAFRPYDDSYDIDNAQFVTTADFNLATAAKTMLEDRKYTHVESEGILSYFNKLHALAKDGEKKTMLENVRQST